MQDIPKTNHRFGDYTIRTISNDEFLRIFRAIRPIVFAESFELDVFGGMNDSELAAARKLGQRMGARIRIPLGVFLKDEPVGWTNGWQVDQYKYYMASSGVLPAHRRQGIYAELLRIILEQAEAIGFQSVFSRHVATNSGILIPKLQAGFLIQGTEISPTYGMLIHLTYYFNERTRKLHYFRAGGARPDDEILAMLAAGDSVDGASVDEASAA